MWSVPSQPHPHPDPGTVHPVPEHPSIVYLAPLVTQRQVANLHIGDYTYYHDPDGAERFFENILYHFDFVGDALRIGRFCALAQGIRFIMNGANHAMGGVSTYPIFIFPSEGDTGHGWQAHTPPPSAFPYKGDTVLGSDVWVGHGATFLPGAQVGHGSIVAAQSVVGGTFEPYSVIGGNPARRIRTRFDDATIRRLVAIAWWDWPVERITANLHHISATYDDSTLDALEQAAATDERGPSKG